MGGKLELQNTMEEVVEEERLHHCDRHSKRNPPCTPTLYVDSPAQVAFEAFHSEAVAVVAP